MKPITNTTFEFLKGIKKNNNREWFTQNRELYERASGEFLNLVETLIAQISKFDPAIGGLRSKECVFRIFRDVRFSKEKSPYKTNFGASFSPGGRKSSDAMYYIHIEPNGKSMVAAGHYHPEKNVLNAIRDAIARDPAPLRKLLNGAALKKGYGELWDDDMLKSVPRGFDREHPAADLLRYKNFILARRIPDSDVLGDAFVSTIVSDFRKLKPFNDYFRSIVG